MKRLKGIPLGFKGSALGVKFYLMHQYDIEGNITIQAYDAETNKLIFDLHSGNRRQANDQFNEYILTHDKYKYAGYRDAEKEIDVIEKVTLPFMRMLEKDIKEHNKNKSKMPKKKKATKRPVKAKAKRPVKAKAPAKRKAKAPAKRGRKAKPMHQISVPGYSKAVDQLKKAKAPGKRTSESGRTYYESRVNRSDMPGKLTGKSASITGWPGYVDEYTVKQVYIFAVTDFQLYDIYRIKLIKKAKRQLEAGTFTIDKAAKDWLGFVNAATKKYNSLFKVKKSWTKLLTIGDRKLLARECAADVLEEWKANKLIGY